MLRGILPSDQLLETYGLSEYHDIKEAVQVWGKYSSWYPLEVRCVKVSHPLCMHFELILPAFRSCLYDHPFRCLPALQSGDVALLLRCLETNQVSFVQAGTYLLLEKLLLSCYRRLFKK